MSLADVKFVEAYRSAHAVQAHALKYALEDAGIPVIIEGEALQDAVGDIPGGWSSTPRLMVRESQLEAAREIIRQTDRSVQSQQVETTHCLACHAVMSESEEACAKCGWSYSQTDGLEPDDDEDDE